MPPSGPYRGLCVALVAAAVLLGGGCAIGGDGIDDEPVAGSDAGTPAVSLDPALVPPPVDGAGDGGGTSSTSVGGGAGGDGSSVPDDAAPPAPATPTEGSAPPPRTLAVAHDPLGDAGLANPAYADLLTVELLEVGTTARFVVDVAGAFPTLPADGEVLGLGVDLYDVPGAPESTSQVFVLGESTGWTAYLTTPAGIEALPGTFQLGAGRIVLELPWDRLAVAGTGELDAFLDWSDAGTVVASSSADRIAPRTPYAR